jgi:hypothetical protein
VLSIIAPSPRLANGYGVTLGIGRARRTLAPIPNRTVGRSIDSLQPVSNGVDAEGERPAELHHRDPLEAPLPAPTTFLERTRGRILAPDEHLRVASRVDIIQPLSTAAANVSGRFYLALTDQRLLLVSRSIQARRAEIIAEWPTGKLNIKAAKRRLGNNLIHIETGEGEDLWLEWISGNRPQEWANLRFRQ